MKPVITTLPLEKELAHIKFCQLVDKTSVKDIELLKDMLKQEHKHHLITKLNLVNNLKG